MLHTIELMPEDAPFCTFISLSESVVVTKYSLSKKVQSYYDTPFLCAENRIAMQLHLLRVLSCATKKTLVSWNLHPINFGALILSLPNERMVSEGFQFG